MFVIRHFLERGPTRARKNKRIARWVFPGACVLTNTTIIILSGARSG